VRGRWRLALHLFCSSQGKQELNSLARRSALRRPSLLPHFLPQTRRGPAGRVRESFSPDRRQFLLQLALNSTLFNSQPRTTPTSNLCYREPSLLHDGSQPSKPAVHDFDDPIARFALRCQPQAKPTWPTSFSHRAIHLDAHASD